MLRAVSITAVAMVAFAANLVLARAALELPAIDAASYTVVRLVSGAAVLGLLLSRRGGAELRHPPGSWTSAAALFGYAIAFSLAYLRLGAATGALILFASVQLTMIVWGLATRDRPRPAELVGVGVAFAAFVHLLLPGLSAPDPLGSGLMILSGVAWGVYSLRGRGSRDPLGETAGNFIRSVAFCAPLALVALLDPTVTGPGLALAAASGALASGLGYAVWYRALPLLSTTQGAAVQLTVPAIAALGGVAFLGEVLTLRLTLSAALILGGVALALFWPRRRS